MSLSIISALCLVMTMAGSAWGRQPGQGAVEIAPFTGGLLRSMTFDDPEVPGGVFTVKSTLIGADVVYYPRARFGAGASVVRQAVTIGPAEQRTALSATLAGGLAKYRVPISRRTSLVMIGSGGLVASRLVTPGTDAGETRATRAMFALVGTGLSVTAGQHVSLDVSVRGVFNRLRSSGDEGAGRGGVMAVFGIALWIP